jgi:hypothetical protein
MFLAKVLGITIEESLLDNTGKFRLDKAELIAYSHGSYYSLSDVLGTFGYSVKKKTKKKHR